MKVGVLVKIDRDESGNFKAPEVTAYPPPAEAQDAMLADFVKTEAYIAGADGADVSWWAFEREV